MSTDTTMNTEAVASLEVVPDEIAKVVAREQVEPSTRETLLTTFSPIHRDITRSLRTAAAITSGEDPLQRKLARECRLALRSARCEADNTRKRLKADALSFGRAVDGVANVIKYLCEPEEARLAEIERYEEVRETKRRAVLRAAREAALLEVGGDPSIYQLDAMSEETWATVLAGAKAATLAREEAARKAEADRIAREEAERIAREEQIRVAREAAERARVEAERERAARLAAEENARRELEVTRKAADEERRRIEAERAKEREIARKQQADAEKRERLLRDEADAVRRREAAEAAKRHEEERVARQAAERAARAPDKEKLDAFVAALSAVPLPECGTLYGAAAARDILAWREDFVKRAAARVQSL